MLIAIFQGKIFTVMLTMLTLLTLSDFQFKEQLNVFLQRLFGLCHLYRLMYYNWLQYNCRGFCILIEVVSLFLISVNCILFKLPQHIVVFGYCISIISGCKYKNNRNYNNLCISTILICVVLYRLCTVKEVAARTFYVFTY